jgi:hypothetical protein
MSKGVVLAFAIAMLGEGRSIQTQELTLQQLTPTPGPPANCDPLRVQEEPLSVGRTLNTTVPSNPWIGSDRKTVAAIREMIYGAPRLPDAPILPLRDLTTFLLQLAEGIEEGYVAAYQQAEKPRTFVYGLRFSEAEGVPDAPRVRSGNTTLAWIQTRRIVAVVHGDNGECSNSVAAHVKSLVYEKP